MVQVYGRPRSGSQGFTQPADPPNSKVPLPQDRSNMIPPSQNLKPSPNDKFNMLILCTVHRYSIVCKEISEGVKLFNLNLAYQLDTEASTIKMGIMETKSENFGQISSPNEKIALWPFSKYKDHLQLI